MPFINDMIAQSKREKSFSDLSRFTFDGRWVKIFKRYLKVIKKQYLLTSKNLWALHAKNTAMWEACNTLWKLMCVIRMPWLLFSAVVMR